MESRRHFLRWALSIAIGASIFVAAEEVNQFSSLVETAERFGGSSDMKPQLTDTSASLLTVRAYYSMMAQYTSVSEEFFVLQSPATLHDLIGAVIVRHPSTAGMAQTMLILLNGVPAKPTATLKDGDEVQFIPLSTGG